MPALQLKLSFDRNRTKLLLRYKQQKKTTVTLLK